VLTTLANYRLFSSNLDRQLTTTSQKPQVARESEYYLANISKAKSIDDFLADDRLFNYAMKAFGLSDMSYAKAFMRKVLEEGIDSSNTFANKLSDSRYKEFAATFNFARFGTVTTIMTDAQQGTVDRYTRQTMEEDAGSQNEGVRLALYFERKASTITSPYSILADKALLQVVQTSLGLPATMSMLDIDKQADMITKKLDVEDFKDPEKVEKFLMRFTALWDVNNSTVAETSPAALLIGGSSTPGVSGGLLTAIQNLRLGGA